MCDSIVDGGLRCASDARPAYDLAKFGTREWDEAAPIYAATPGGLAEMTAVRDTAARFGNVEKEVAFTLAIEKGQRIRAAALVTKAVSAGQPLSTVGTYPDWYPATAGTKPIDHGEWAGDPAWIKAWNATPAEKRAPMRMFHVNRSQQFGYDPTVHMAGMATVADRARDIAATELDLYGPSDYEANHDKIAKKAARMMYVHEVHWTGDIHPAVLDDSQANTTTNPTYLSHESLTADVDPDSQTATMVALQRQFWSPGETPDDGPVWQAGATGVSYWNQIEGRGLPSMVIHKDAGGYKYVKARKLKAADLDHASVYRKQLGA